MDLKSRKIEFVQESFKFQNEESVSRFKELPHGEKLKDDDFEPMTTEEFKE